MPRRLAWLLVGLIFFPTELFAQCQSQPRDVTFGKNDVSKLKSYTCQSGAGPDSAQFRVEYYRLSDVTVSLLLAGGSSVKLRKTLGSPKLVQNEVAKTYADLVKKFGVTEETTQDLDGWTTNFTASSGEEAPSPYSSDADNASDQVQDKIGPKKLRTLLGLGGIATLSGTEYPAVSEIDALRQKNLPESMNYYYTESDPDIGCDKANFSCKKFGSKVLTMTPWRYMTLEDVENYNTNAKRYNAELMKLRKDKAGAKDDQFETGAVETNYEKLIKFISNGALPADFLVLGGKYTPEDCGSVSPGDLPGLGGWTFNMSPRDVKIEAVLIENLSKKPLAVGGLFGERDASGGLKAFERDLISPTDPVFLDSTSAVIEPGNSAVVLTKIVFITQPDSVKEFRKYRESMEAIHQAIGPNGFSGHTSAYQAPDPKDYTYGPTLTVSGAQVNSARVDFTSAPAMNFIELTALSEAGSCPYLLSLDEHDGEWITYGKILHKGQGSANAYTEATTFPGLRTHFRIEEREPEIAHLQSVLLVVSYRDGTERRVLPTRPTDISGTPEIRLMWNEATEVDFSVPPGENGGDDVIETRLEVAGYYDRYSSLLAEQENRELLATPVPVRLNTADSVPAQH